MNKIAENFGLKVTSKTKVSEIQDRMMQNKPANLTVYEYMRELWNKFGHKGRNEDVEEINPRSTHKKKGRKASEISISENQVRNIATRSIYIQQKHKRLQLALREKLARVFGKDCVVLFEENNVDVRLIQPRHIVFYEVKSASYATNCIKEALGQLLHYSFCDDDPKEKKLVVVGQYTPTSEDLKFSTYIKSLLNIDFDYENIELTN